MKLKLGSATSGLCSKIETAPILFDVLQSIWEESALDLLGDTSTTLNLTLDHVKCDTSARF